MPAFAIKIDLSSKPRGLRSLTQVVEADAEFTALEIACREARAYADPNDVISATRDRRYSVEKLVG